ncbi:MAG: GMC family oxidoreductase N-terminal domain-containing protein [Meiothermus sp.]|nr:GMC family oxidoreductase N-terminal domain-containing protein [Meiothermus sp.]
MIQKAHTIVLGGGTAGAAVAAILAEAGVSVLLVEAGPDYGAIGNWPKELLDASTMPLGSHDWGYVDTTSYPARRVHLHRARVLGGCSAINGCGVVWGHRSDYDGWEALGNPGWHADAMLPILERASRRLRSTAGPLEELSPYHRFFLQSAANIGIPTLDNLNDLERGEGAGVGQVNIVDGVRWNTALAYIEPVRHLGNMKILSNALVDKILVQKNRATAAEVIQQGQRLRLEGERMVICAGTYGSPAILQRSGIGDARMLEPLGIEVKHALNGVGRNLQDHPEVDMVFAGSAELERLMDEYREKPTSKAVGAFAKVYSGVSEAPFDLHFYPDQLWQGGQWVWNYGISAQVSHSRGYLSITSTDPEDPPHIHHGYLSDPEGLDLAMLANGYERLLELVRAKPLADYLGPVQGGWSELRSRADLEALIRRLALHTWHPVGTCKMGPASDATAVVDPTGKVHGLENLFVADASIMPVITKCNTNLPTLAIAEKIAEGLLSER